MKQSLYNLITKINYHVTNNWYKTDLIFNSLETLGENYNSKQLSVDITSAYGKACIFKMSKMSSYQCYQMSR